MSNARKNRVKGSNPLSVLANDSDRDRCKTGAVRAPRKVKVTDSRVTVGRKISFAAEFPMATHEWHHMSHGRVGTRDKTLTLREFKTSKGGFLK